MFWTCPACGKSFRNKNQWHSCYRLNLDDHLLNKPPEIKELVFRLISEVKTFGKIEINPVKSVLQIKAGATFLSIKTKKEYVELEFQLGEEINEFPIHRTIRISGNRVLHFLCLQSAKEVNEQLIQWLKASYHLVR
jgi:hypothetical protein